MKTLIMAGGKGTRISKLFPDMPKPLIPMKNRNGVEKPILEWEILSLVNQGFSDITLTVSHMAEQIMRHFGDGRKFGARIDYFVEEEPLGNAGALFKLRDSLSNPFLLLNADAAFDIDFHRFLNAHKEKDALVTLFTHPNSHPYDSGLIVSDENGAVTGWLAKEDKRPQWYKNRVNAGLHVVNPAALDMSGIDPARIGERGPDGKIFKVDLDRQILKPLCGTGKMFRYDSPEYVQDMGTPERFRSVSRDFAAGIVESKNLRNRQKAVFLDRDGTINKYAGFLTDINEFELIDGVAEAIRRIHSHGYLAIVVTNQPVVARGEATVEELQRIHDKMETELGAQGAYIDGLYYCPHHPHKGYPGEVPELKRVCDCRKPKPGMLFAASADFNIDLAASWMVGDGENDVGAGKAAGCGTIKIGEDCGADYVASDLLNAVAIIFADTP